MERASYRNAGTDYGFDVTKKEHTRLLFAYMFLSSAFRIIC